MFDFDGPRLKARQEQRELRLTRSNPRRGSIHGCKRMP